MEIKLYQVDAFTDSLFGGNPAAVCPLTEWLPDKILQSIAGENNLAETAFFVNYEEKIELRWFTPTTEVDLCGHATLAAAYVLFNYEGFNESIINFHSPRSGRLSVEKNDEYLKLDFPADELEKVGFSKPELMDLSLVSNEIYKGKSDYMFVLGGEDEVKGYQPDFNRIAKISARGIIITAPGSDVDFVSRFFGPQSGVPEDHVTGSAHTTLIPYWSDRLNKVELSARQLSLRGGYLRCEYHEERVKIAGQAKIYSIGKIVGL